MDLIILGLSGKDDLLQVEKDHQMDEAQYRSIHLQDARGLLDDIMGSRPWDPASATD